VTTTHCLLAIDLGTQSLRVSALASTGERLWGWARPVESRIEGDVFEQSTQQWQALLDEALADAGRAGIRPDAIAAAAPLAGFVALDAQGRAMTPAVLYADRRSAPYLEPVEAALARHPGANPHGLRVYVPDPLPHWLRLRAAEPGVFARMRRLLDATGWLNRYLTGVDTLNAYTALRLYDAEVRRELGVPEGMFGDPAPIGRRIGALRADLASRHGLPPAPVIAAAFDSKCAYLGSGIERPGDALDISGTVTSCGVVTDTPFDDPQRRVYTVPISARTHLARGSTASSGGTLEWARTHLLERDFPAIDAEILATRASVDGPVFLPYLAGERSPLWNPHARGALLGLSLDGASHARIARAVYEGLAFALRHILAVLASQGAQAQRMLLAGGLSRNDVLCQIKADVLGLPLSRCRDTELTTLGLCAIAGVALGDWPDCASAGRTLVAVDRTFVPDPAEHRVHSANFERYLRYVQALLPTFAPAGREGAP